jgi:hypothetical protein
MRRTRGVVRGLLLPTLSREHRSAALRRASSAVTSSTATVAQRLSSTQIEDFRNNGYLVLDRFIDLELVQRLRSRFEPLFAGKFETGVFPVRHYKRSNSVAYPLGV